MSKIKSVLIDRDTNEPVKSYPDMDTEVYAIGKKKIRIHLINKTPIRALHVTLEYSVESAKTLALQILKMVQP